MIPALPCMLMEGMAYSFFSLFGVSNGFRLTYTTLPGMVNRLTRRDNALTNGVYLSAYYANSACGTYFPGLIYDGLGSGRCSAWRRGSLP